jgi:hypothetical protein
MNIPTHITMKGTMLFSQLSEEALSAKAAP